MKRHLLAPALLAAASLASAAEIHVPGDQPTLQAAIDAASPGDVILVSTLGFGTYQEPVVIDKPLTILGDPQFSIFTKCDFSSPGCTDCLEPFHAFRLAGPGFGRVVIGNVKTIPFDCYVPASSIGGGGFDELHVFNASFVPWSGQTGLGYGSSTIDVDVPHVLVEGSHVVGGKVSSDHCSVFLYDEVYAAIEAPASSVTILASEIEGGGKAYFCCAFCTCPTSLPPGGDGGDAVVANAVFVDAASTVTAGVGATFYAYPGMEPISGVACGKKPDGAVFVAGAVHQLPGAISGSGATPLGGTFVLAFDVPGPLAVLFVSFGVQAPVLVPGAGYSYLPAPLLAGPVPTGAPQSLSFAVPALPALLGLEGAFQIFDLTLGLTAPAACVLGP